MREPINGYNRLLNPKHIPVHDKRAQGIAELMLDVRNKLKQPLTEKNYSTGI